MPQKITEKAILQCNQGTSNTELKVTSQDFFFIENKAIATEQDKDSNVNINPMGVCKLKPIIGGYRSCLPAPLSWINTTQKDEINGFKILLDNSICPCATGGTIKIINKGHTENHETE
ncbi:DUF4280 domain-containing protein [uncultured Apibacter sp.]|uniref:DUF4280 domain-containing protein n=1 Tax=uncultured Apibacter sp. TaxID=1778616 RepID=UPI0025FA56F8|nr:DUF4280 domain-containing protein [uncultured Apibacter sp.]